jgi:hypothetical protein
MLARTLLRGVYVLNWKTKQNQVTCVHSGFDETGVLRARLVQESSRKVTNLKLYCPPDRLIDTLDYQEVALAKQLVEEYLANKHSRRGG